MRFFLFIFTQTLRNICHSWGVQLMTLLTVTLSVLIFSFFYLIYTNMLQAGEKIGEELRLTVYLDAQLSPAGQEEFIKKVNSFGKVEKIIFITPEQAFQRLTKQLGSDSDVLADLSPAFLPYSAEIYPHKDLRNLSRIKEFSDYLTNLPGTQKVQYGQAWVERFGHFIKLLRFIVIISGTLLILTTMFMVSYTLRLTLYARQDELKVLRYLGATNSYIKGPVLIEGFALGLFGSGLGLAALFFLFQWIKHHFSSAGFLGLFELRFLPMSDSAIILLGSIMLCTLGSLLSIRRLLKK
ncbi:MAG: permease-like cell division protein FtsX [Desulfobulbaceae bacterium]|nr:permease-like cell division protein FtsX [Desulfobulbaceae bacterium]